MSNPKIFKADTGHVFRLKVRDQDAQPVDLTGASETLLVFVKPDSTSDGRVGTVTGSPTNGVVEYTTEADLLNQSGEWKVQLHIVTPNGSWRSNPIEFTVYDPIY